MLREALISPRHARAEHPEHAIEHQPVAQVRPPSPMGFDEEAGDYVPGLVRALMINAR